MAILEGQSKPKLRLLCLHGFRTSARILEEQLGKWNASLLDHLDLIFLEAPFPASGKSDVEGKFPPPFFEWYLWNSDYTEYAGLQESINYISEYMKEHGPFDGLLGFSQGAIIAAYLTCLQQKGLALVSVPPVDLLVVIGGATFISCTMEFAYQGPIQCPSIHFLGEKDYLLKRGEDLVKSFHNPLVINHQYGHTIPRLDVEATSKVIDYLLQVKNQVSGNQEESRDESWASH